MSRFSEYDGEEPYNNASSLWEKRAQLALEGRRGRAALAELREALMALPDHRLIESAVCRPKVENEVVVGGDVCVIGAYLWHQKVKAGVDPVVAFGELPQVDTDDEEQAEDLMYGAAMTTTAELGRDAGLTYTLAWELAYKNDEDYAGLTPEERFGRMVGFIDKQLAKPPLKAAPRRVRRRRQRRPVDERWLWPEFARAIRGLRPRTPDSTGAREP